MEAKDCTNPNRPYIVSVDHAAKTGIVYRPRCKQWTCEFCAEQNAGDWRIRVARGVNYFQERAIDVSFITLTSRGGKGRTRDKSLEAFRRGFPSFRKRVLYANNLFEYIAVPEQHQNGVVHMHLIATYHGTKRLIKDAAYKSGLGYMADVRYVDSGVYAAWYISKYIGKDFIGLKWPAKFRRVRCSNGWPKVEADPPPDEREHTAFFSVWDVQIEVDHFLLQDYEIEWRKSATRDD